MSNLNVLKQALEALEKAEESVRMVERLGMRLGLSDADLRMDKETVFKPALKSLRQAIAEAEKQEHQWCRGECVKCGVSIEKQEPVAWQWLTTANFRKKLPKNAEKGAWNPLYTSPPQRQPLTDEQIADMRANRHWLTAKDKAPYLAGIRDAEAAHGIKGEA